MTVVGSAGIAVFDDTKPWAEKLLVYRQHITWADGNRPTANKVVGEAIVPVESEPLANECMHFIDRCRDRATPRTDGREGLRVFSVLRAAQRSLDAEGEAVDPAACLPSTSSRKSPVSESSVVDDRATVRIAGRIPILCAATAVVDTVPSLQGCKIGTSAT